jgi:hypothetical protein
MRIADSQLSFIKDITMIRNGILLPEKDNKSLNWETKYHWTVISMKNDWKTIFAE